MGGHQKHSGSSANTMDRDAPGSKLIKRCQSDGTTQNGTGAILFANLLGDRWAVCGQAVDDDGCRCAPRHRTSPSPHHPTRCAGQWTRPRLQPRLCGAWAARPMRNPGDRDPGSKDRSDGFHLRSDGGPADRMDDTLLRRQDDGRVNLEGLDSGERANAQRRLVHLERRGWATRDRQGCWPLPENLRDILRSVGEQEARQAAATRTI